MVEEERIRKSSDMSVPKLDKIRFAIGSKTQRHSSSWAITFNKSDVYVGARYVMGTMKISLHESGHCKLALDRKHWQHLADLGIAVRNDWAFVRWKKSPTPVSGAVHVMSVTFPSDFQLLNAPRVRENKPVIYLEPAPTGQAIEVGLFYSKEPPASLGAKLEKTGLPMFNAQLENGEFVSVVGRVVRFDKTQYEGLSGTAKPLAKDVVPEPGEEVRDLSATLFNKPKDFETLLVTEVTGFTLRRGAA